LSRATTLGLADLLRPPSKLCQPVLDGADGQTRRLPVRDKAFDVLGSQAVGAHVPKAQVTELAGDQIQHALAVPLRGETAVAVPLAQLLQLKVQIPHSLSSDGSNRPSPMILSCRVNCCWCE
jgi:hypothetical protein